MKKLVLLAIVAIIGAVNVNAQDNKSEVSVSVGAYSHISNGWIIDAFTTVLDKAEKDRGVPISVEYLYEIAPKLKVGAALTYQRMSAKLEGKKGVNNAISIMPAIKYSWIDKDHFALYSKAAVGYCLNLKSGDKELRDEFEQHHFAFQASLIGAEVGSQNIRAFVEAGYGFQGIVQAGIKVRF